MKYTEADTNQFYNEVREALYQQVWNARGILHWGVFPNTMCLSDITPRQFSIAMERLNKFVLNKCQLHLSQRVLDAGCGNGITASWIASVSKARVYGVDLSAHRIQSARQHVKTLTKLKNKVFFRCASLEKLPFKNNYFHAAYSQSTLYHVHHKEKAFKEIYRVLKKNGLFVFDDLFKPQKSISALGKKYVYDRLLFDTPYNFCTYQECLMDLGFQILEAHNLTDSLLLTYQYLAKHTEKILHHESSFALKQLKKDFAMTAKAIQQGDLGWGLYVIKKR